MGGNSGMGSKKHGQSGTPGHGASKKQTERVVQAMENEKRAFRDNRRKAACQYKSVIDLMASK